MDSPTRLWREPKPVTWNCRLDLATHEPRVAIGAVPIARTRQSFGGVKSATYSCVGLRPSRLLVHITFL